MNPTEIDPSEAKRRITELRSQIDMLSTIAARSDQQNYDDYLGGPKVLTISEVRSGSAEQPIEIHVSEFPGRPYKPSKSMRRVIVSAWGPDASVYTGRKIELYGDPDVKFGGQTVGGIKIRGLSNIDKPLTVSLTETRGKRKPHRVEPLPDAPPPITPAQVTAFEGRIHTATTPAHLDNIAADLKAFDLGTHRKALGQTWNDRKNAIEAGSEG